jgi:hypothetical protein
MDKTIVEVLFKEGLSKYLEDSTLSNISFSAFFSVSMTGSWSGGAGAIKNGISIGLDSPDNAEDALKKYFKQIKDTPERFNKFRFELQTDGNYRAEYLWDEEYILQQHLWTVNQMPEWFFDKLTQRLEYWGYGNDWQTGQIVVKVRENEVFCEAYIVENEQKITVTQDIVIEFEDYEFRSDILGNYQMTNFGILKDLWQKGRWNTFVIHCPQKDNKTGIRFLNEERDIEYIWEQ